MKALKVLSNATYVAVLAAILGCKSSVVVGESEQKFADESSHVGSDGCYTLYEQTGISRKGQLCLYSWLGEVGEGAGGTIVAYFSVDGQKLLYCKRVIRRSRTNESQFLITSDTTIKFSGNVKQGTVTLGRTSYRYENAEVDGATIYKRLYNQSQCAGEL